MSPVSLVPAGTSYEIGDVFTPAAIPTVTFVDRSSHAALKDLKFSLLKGGLVNVYGDTKSGKTVLCCKLLERRNPILLHGDFIRKEEQFWRQLANALAIGDYQIQNSFTQRTDAQTRRALAKFRVFGTEFGGEGGSEAVDTGSEGHEIRTTTEPSDVVRELIRTRRPVIIDDFHRAEKAAREAIIEKCKAFTDHGVVLVLVSIPNELGAPSYQGEKADERVGREAAQRSPLWEKKEIRQIGEKGFAALNVVINDDALDHFTSLAYRNPLLMQLYCLRLCVEKGLEKTSDTEQHWVLSQEEVRNIVRECACGYDASFAAYLGLDSNDEKRWTLQNGKRVNLSVLTTLALAGISIRSPVLPSRLCKRIANLLEPGTKPPLPPHVSQTLGALARRMAENKPPHYMPELQVDEKGCWYITHPFFRVYVQWRLLPQFIDFRPKGARNKLASAPDTREDH